MNPEPENFEQLRRLLVLKRYEQPPPGYFDRFSRQVLIRIQADQSRSSQSFFARLFNQTPWLARIRDSIESKPAMAGVLAITVCGMVTVAVLSSETAPIESIAAFPAPVLNSEKPMEMAGQSVPTPLPRQASATGFSSTMGAASGEPRDSLFSEIQRSPEQPSTFFGAHADLVSFQK
jgi:hypothetical protein